VLTLEEDDADALCNTFDIDDCSTKLIELTKDTSCQQTHHLEQFEVTATLPPLTAVRLPCEATSLTRTLSLILPSLCTNGTDFSLCHRPSYSSPCIPTRFEFLWTTPRCLVDPLTLLCLTAAPNSNTMISHGFACITKNMCRWLTHLTPGIVEFQLEIESNLVSLPPESPRSNTRKLDSNWKISSAVHCYFHLQSIFQLFFRSSSSGFNFEDFPLSPLNSLWR
jgi:hypothetical protein